MPPEQLGVPLVLLQTVPHMPQLPVLVLVFVSQSVPEVAQWAKPGLQVPTAHLPWLQVGVPFAVVQMLPQVPQLLGSVWVFFSQPSAALMLQSAQPPLAQVTILHVPDTHASVALFMLHMLFCAGAAVAGVAVLVCTSQPLAGLLSQLA